MIWLILCAVCVGMVALFQFGLMVLGWLFPSDRVDETIASAEPATVIIALHNEAPNELAGKALRNRLLLSVQQDYPCQILLIDDRSTDFTPKILTQLSEEHEQVSVIRVDNTPDNASPKKWALRQGIEAAETDILVFTDADCFPHPFWLEHITRPLRNGKAISLGYSPPRSENSLLNLVQRFETFSTAFLYLGMARIGLAYMGVGRNIAYRKSLLDEPAFESHLSVLSGDDDLFINQYATAQNVGIVLHDHSQVRTQAKRTWRSWLLQKIRHVSASKHYRLRNQLLLGLHGLSLSGAYLFAIPTAIFWQVDFGLFLIALTAALRSVTMIPAALQLKSGQLIPFLVILEMFQLIYNFTIVPLGWILKPIWQKTTTNPPNAH